MKNILKLIVGATMQTVAAPVILTGRGTQAVGHFAVKTGEGIELTGLRMDDNGEGKRSSAKEALAIAKAARAEARAKRQKVDKTSEAHYRKSRIAQLTAAKSARETIDKMVSEPAPDINAVREAVLSSITAVPAQ